MPLTALSLVILAGLIHASWNIAAKKSGGDLRFIAFSSLVILVVWMPVGLGVGWNVVPHWGWHEWACIVASAVLHVLYFSALLRGYREADLTGLPDRPRVWAFAVQRSGHPVAGRALQLDDRLGRAVHGAGRVPDCWRPVNVASRA